MLDDMEEGGHFWFAEVIKPSIRLDVLQGGGKLEYLAELMRLRNKGMHAEFCKDRSGVSHALERMLPIGHPIPSDQQAGIIEIRTPQLWFRANSQGDVQGGLKVGFRSIPPTIESGDNSENAWKQKYPPTREKHAAFHSPSQHRIEPRG
jgi:hypothetical protein